MMLCIHESLWGDLDALENRLVRFMSPATRLDEQTATVVDGAGERYRMWDDPVITPDLCANILVALSDAPGNRTRFDGVFVTARNDVPIPPDTMDEVAEWRKAAAVIPAALRSDRAQGRGGWQEFPPATEANPRAHVDEAEARFASGLASRMASLGKGAVAPVLIDQRDAVSLVVEAPE